jgi:hypothetical protein
MMMDVIHAQPAPSLVQWFLGAMGWFWTLSIMLSGFAVFIGACLVVGLNRRPGVIATYLVFLPLPVLIGLFACIDGRLNAYRVLDTASGEPRLRQLALAEATSLVSVYTGMLVTIPSYFVIAFGLLVRAISAKPADPLTTSSADRRMRSG